jgi:hypothetical protein
MSFAAAHMTKMVFRRNGKLFCVVQPRIENVSLAVHLGRSGRQAARRLPNDLMLRDVEGMSTTDAAEVLEFTEDNVKVRLHRARGCARVFTRVLEWKGKKHSIFMPCGAIEL